MLPNPANFMTESVTAMVRRATIARMKPVSSALFFLLVACDGEIGESGVAWKLGSR